MKLQKNRAGSCTETPPIRGFGEGTHGSFQNGGQNMKKTGRRWLCGLLTAALLGGIPAYAEGAAPAQPQEAEQAVMDVWVQNSADRAFASSTMPEQAAQKIELYAARSE